MRSLALRPTALLAASLIVLAGCGDDVSTPDGSQPAGDQEATEEASPDAEETPAAADGQADDTAGTADTADEDPADGEGAAAAALTCAELAGSEQALLDTAALGAWTGETGGFSGLCSIDGADGFVTVFTAMEATPEEYFAANGYGEASSDGDIVTATTEFGVPTAGTVVDGRVVMATIDGTVEARTTADATAALRVALDALAS